MESMGLVYIECSAQLAPISLRFLGTVSASSGGIQAYPLWGMLLQHCLVPTCSLCIKSQNSIFICGRWKLRASLQEFSVLMVDLSSGLWHIFPDTWQRASWGSLQIENVLEPEKPLLCLIFGQCSSSLTCLLILRRIPGNLQNYNQM